MAIKTDREIDRQRARFLPFNDFGKGEFNKGNHRIENPVSKPLPVISRRLGLNCPNRGIPEKMTQMKKAPILIFKKE